MKPNLSYIIWFSQSTGSTLLCQALASTGIAGRPAELLHHGIVDFLGVAGDSPYSVAPPFYEKLADEVSEQWVRRYREERQRG